MKNTQLGRRVLVILLAGIAFLAPAAAQAQTSQRNSPDALPSQPIAGSARGVHDPSIIKAGSTWYVFATGGDSAGQQLPIRCSANLRVWTACGFVFPQLPAWIHDRLAGVRDLWAPDISFEDGEYRLYYTYSAFGKNTSGIALATNKTLDSTSPAYHWLDRGMILESRTSDDFNAIDANFIRDQKGQDWLAFGSFWSGIKLRHLAKDGTASKTDTTTYSLAKRARPQQPPDAAPGLPPSWQAIEAPFIARHGDYFYLFTSWDLCCHGANSTYHVQVGRSRNVTGPYVDKAGVKLTDGGGSEVLSGNGAWAGPGGQSIWSGPGDQALMAFHAYDKTGRGSDGKPGAPYLQISPIRWQDDWPQVEMVR